MIEDLNLEKIYKMSKEFMYKDGSPAETSKIFLKVQASFKKGESLDKFSREEIGHSIFFLFRANRNAGMNFEEYPEKDKKLLKEMVSSINKKKKKDNKIIKEKIQLVGIVKLTKDVNRMYLKKGYLGRLVKKGSGLTVLFFYGLKSVEVPLEDIKDKVTIKKLGKKYENSREYEDDLLRLYQLKYITLCGYQTMADIERWLKGIDKEREKPFEKARIEYLRTAKLEVKLTPTEICLRENMLAAWDMHESRAVPSYNDPDKCPDPYMREGIKKGMALMEDITKRVDLKRIKEILTPTEYRRFLPVYDEFKKTGKYTISNPHVRD